MAITSDNLKFDNLIVGKNYANNVLDENGNWIINKINPSMNSLIEDVINEDGTTSISEFFKLLGYSNRDSIIGELKVSKKDFNNKFYIRITTTQTYAKGNSNLSNTLYGRVIIGCEEYEENDVITVNVYETTSPNYEYDFDNEENNNLFYFSGIDRNLSSNYLNYYNSNITLKVGTTEISNNNYRIDFIKNDEITNKPSAYFFKYTENVLPDLTDSYEDSDGNSIDIDEGLKNINDFKDSSDGKLYQLINNKIFNDSILLIFSLESFNINADFNIETMSLYIDDELVYLKPIYKENVDNSVSTIGYYYILDIPGKHDLLIEAFDDYNNYYSSLITNINIVTESLEPIIYTGVYNGQKQTDDYHIRVKLDEEKILDEDDNLIDNPNYGIVSISIKKDGNNYETEMSEILVNGVKYLSFNLTEVDGNETEYEITIIKKLKSDNSVFIQTEPIKCTLLYDSIISSNNFIGYIDRFITDEKELNTNPVDVKTRYALVIYFNDSNPLHEISYSLNGSPYKKYAGPFIVYDDLDLSKSYYKLKVGNRTYNPVSFGSGIYRFNKTRVNSENSGLEIIEGEKDYYTDSNGNEISIDVGIENGKSYNSRRKIYFARKENSESFINHYIFIDGNAYYYNNEDNKVYIVNNKGNNDIKTVIDSENPYIFNKTGWHYVSILAWNNVLPTNLYFDTVKFKLNNPDNNSLRKPSIIEYKNYEDGKSKVVVKFYSFNNKITNSIEIEYMDENGNKVNDKYFYKTYSPSTNIVELPLIDQSCKITAKSEYVDGIYIEINNPKNKISVKNINIYQSKPDLSEFKIHGIQNFEFHTQNKIISNGNLENINSINLNIGSMAYFLIPKDKDNEYEIYINGYSYQTYKEKYDIEEMNYYPIIRNKDEELRHYRIEVICKNKYKPELESYYYNEFIIDSLGFAFPKLNNLTTYLMNKTALPKRIINKHEENIDSTKFLLNNRIIDLKSYILKKDDEYILTMSYYYYNGSIRTSSFYFSINSNIIDELKPLRLILKLKDFQDIPYYYDKSIEDEINSEAKDGELIIDRNTGHLYFGNKNGEINKIEIIPITKDMENIANKIESDLLSSDKELNDISYMKNFLNDAIDYLSNKLNDFMDELELYNNKLNNICNEINNIVKNTETLNTNLIKFNDEINTKISNTTNGSVNYKYNIRDILIECENIMDNFYRTENMYKEFSNISSDVRIDIVNINNELKKKCTRENYSKRIDEIKDRVNAFASAVNKFYFE